ncbi:MAG: hypothetical protein B7X06_00045 [Verrucomicrobia bacterium 21-51-4]|nr:MAG: hypothetical protein B7X06_00045 [Verrucomicrobia bacterium 21-51-4]HQU08357.1 DUF2190 family protein [Opitutales bacterium]
MDRVDTWIAKIFKKFTELFGNIDGVITLSNAHCVGVHDRVLTFVCASDIPEAGLLVCRTDAQAMTCTLAQGGQWPVGVALAAASKGEALSVALLGSAATTLRVLSASPIEPGKPVYSTAEGRVQREPKAPGTYYRVGLALTGADAANHRIEVDPTASLLKIYAPYKETQPVAEPVA